MQWTKIAVFALMITVIFVVGLFGSHFGYSVSGVPRNAEFAVIQPLNPGQIDTKYQVTFKDGTSQVMTMDQIKATAKSKANVLDYIGALVTFGIDGMPMFLSGLFLLFCLLAMYILVSLFLPGGSG